MNLIEREVTTLKNTSVGEIPTESFSITKTKVYILGAHIINDYPFLFKERDNLQTIKGNKIT